MFEGFEKLPQFLQFCVGLGCCLGAIYAAYGAIKARKFFASTDREPTHSTLEEKMSEFRRTLYDRMERYGRAMDDRYDKLDERVRENETDVAQIKGKLGMG